eukprot:scaffold132684_cov75-Phaeocystis_antarctica.AAC.1
MCCPASSIPPFAPAAGGPSPHDRGRPVRPSVRCGQPRVELAVHAHRGRPDSRRANSACSSPQPASPSKRHGHRARETGVARALDACDNGFGGLVRNRAVSALAPAAAGLRLRTTGSGLRLLAGQCTHEQDMFSHSDEIDSAAEVKVLFEGLTGQTCGSPTSMYTWDSVPLFYQ